MKRALALGLALPLIASVLAACGGGKAEPAAEEPTPPPEEAPAPAPEEVPQEVQPVVGGTLREGYDLDFSRMDPINTNWYDPGFFTLYDAMLTNDADGNYVPQLAETWEFSEDGLTATFHLRPGVAFHSGRALDSTAIKEVYETIKDPKSGSPLGSLAAPMESFETPDPNTLVIKLSHPYYDLLNVLKTGYWRIVNTELRTKLGEDYGKNEIDGSGPFTFVEWIPGDHVTVNRWDSYPGSIVPYFQNKGTAYLDSIRWAPILEAAQRAIQIEGGEIDTLHAPAFQDVGRLQGNSDLNVLSFAEWSGYIMTTNFKKTPPLEFSDLRVRQAMSHAIDRQSIVDNLLFGHGEPLFGPINSADLYYNPEVEQLNQFDLQQAKDLMGEAGWKPGADGILAKGGQKQKFDIYIDNESFNQELAAVIQAQLKELGMDVKVVSSDRGTFFSKILAEPGVDTSMFFYLWPVPVDVVSLFVNTKTIPVPNWGYASIPEVDAAIDQWQNAANADELQAAGENFHLVVAQNLPITPIVNRKKIWVHRKNVHGWLPHQWNLYPYYNDVWLEG
jgi:peptide/nickel transport system substrate-binding protein